METLKRWSCHFRASGNLRLWIPAFAGIAILLFTLEVYAAERIISRVSVTPKTIDLAKGDVASVNFNLLSNTVVDVKIFDEFETLVRELGSGKKLEKGSHSVRWDGRDQSGEQVVSGVYIYILEAKHGLSPKGTTPSEPLYVYDLRAKTGGEEVFVQDLTWNRESGKIKYLLPSAGYVRTRIGLKDGAFFGTLKDWTPYGAGAKEVEWKGGDKSGFFDLSNHPEAQVNISAFALPANSIIVKGRRHCEGTECPKQPQSAMPAKPGDYIHTRHNRGQCHEPKFTVTFPKAKHDGVIPVLDGKTPVRVTLDPKDKDYLVATRFEVMFFVDGVFLYEQEEGTSPMNFYLDTALIGPGEHLLTVNVMDYEDHIGVETRRIKVAPEKEAKDA